MRTVVGTVRSRRHVPSRCTNQALLDKRFRDCTRAHIARGSPSGLLIKQRFVPTRVVVWYRVSRSLYLKHGARAIPVRSSSVSCPHDTLPRANPCLMISESRLPCDEVPLRLSHPDAGQRRAGRAEQPYHPADDRPERGLPAARPTEMTTRSARGRPAGAAALPSLAVLN